MEDPNALALEYQLPAKKLAFHHVTEQIDVPPYEESKKNCSNSQSLERETTKNSLGTLFKEQPCNQECSAIHRKHQGISLHLSFKVGIHTAKSLSGCRQQVWLARFYHWHRPLQLPRQCNLYKPTEAAFALPLSAPNILAHRSFCLQQQSACPAAGPAQVDYGLGSPILAVYAGPVTLVRGCGIPNCTADYTVLPRASY